jgi:epoxyqueuosine reductase
MSLNDLIKAETEHLGFPISGVTRVSPPLHFDTYQRWIDAGLHAGMEYLAVRPAIEKRADLRQVMPDVLSLLVVALQYPSPNRIALPPVNEAAGRVAAYAWGVDYHEIIPPLLKGLVGILEKELGKPVISRAYTDTGAILERDFAQQAGIGWAGKNTCTIVPQQGSYFLLGEALLDVDIEPDEPFQSDHCGTCRKCIDTCPTRAIREDRTIDSAHCISYQTIENKGPIPEPLRKLMGNWVFGCDICQEVCPWNIRFSGPGHHPAVDPDPLVAQPLLRKELILSPQAFNFKFKRSPIRRAKRRGYLRNVAVALGNSRDKGAVPELAKVLENEPEALVRSHAAWALGQLATPPARRALEKARRSEKDIQVVHEINGALE